MTACLLAGCDTDELSQPTDSEPGTSVEETDPITHTPEGAVNILSLGAVGDGVTDDAAALQEAINKAVEGPEGGTVYLPAGTYLIKTWIQLKSNLTIQMEEGAVIRNGINTSSGTSIVFMCGPYSGSGSQTEWERVENITILGGTIDMNGELNAAQTAPKNLPAVVSSTGAIALGYADNVTIRGVTFRDSYNGHAIQICNCDTVLVEDCTFIGQSLPGASSASENSQKEYIQIEPSSQAGFPYATNETFEASQNITFRGCYFGASDKCGEPMVGIGTHSQKYAFEKCNHITVENCTFANVAYSAIRFAGYEDVVIRNNSFVKKSKRESTNFRSGSCVLINVFCVNNTTDDMDLNKRITIDGNSFEIHDPDTRAIRVGKDKAEYKGEVSDIVITNNSISNDSGTDTQMLMSVIRVKNATVTGNTLNGGWRGLYIDRCYGEVTIQNNTAKKLTAENCYIRYTGSNECLSFYTYGDGMVEVQTLDGKYIFDAVASDGASFTGFYTNAARSTLLSSSDSLSYPTDAGQKVEAYADFK